jgi:hypothetical protein
MEINQGLTFRLKGNEYFIEFPRVGEYRRIETLKQSLSLNTYGSMVRSMTAAAEEALDMIDMEAYFSVMCPKLIEDLKCDSFSDLGLLDYKELKREYQEKFVPWWNDIQKLLQPEPKKQKVDGEAESD